VKHSFFAVSFLATSALIGAGCDSALDVAPAVQAQAHHELEPISATVFGERVLLFLEFPRPLAGESARFLAHLSVLATGEPVRAGRVALVIGSTTLVAEGPKRDGLFVPEGSVATPGVHAASLVVTSAQAEERLDLGEIVVHADATDAQRAAEAEAGAPPSGSVPFLMEQQWRIKALVAASAPRSLTSRLVVPAQIRSPEGAEVVVTPPVAGRLVAAENAALPRSGDFVEAGQRLGFVEPPLSATELAQLQALQLEFELKSLDIVRALNDAQVQHDFATREHERVSKLRASALSTAQELDQAEQRRSVARTALEGARAMKEALDQVRAARSERAGDREAGALRFPLVSPLRGTVIAAGRLQGEALTPNDELFRVLDTSRVWVEGHVFEFDLHRIGAAPAGVVTFAALPGTRVDVGGPQRALVVSATVDSVSRTVVVRCEIPSDGGTIKPGMQAELELATLRIDAAVAIPFDAVVMEQGLPTAYVMLEGELFQKRDLELGVRDGDYVEIRKGIAVGEHVAMRGAYVIKLAALSPTSFGAGHQH
jgi:biotin carboxyl carrier protein